MKKAIALFLSVVMLISVVNITAVFSHAEISADGKYEYYISGGKVTIVEYKKKSDTGSFTVPDKIGGYPVTNIEDVCFSQCSLNTVTLPNSVVRVGDIAFEKCAKLETVNFGSGLKEFGTNVFSETPKLLNINVSTANPYFKSVNGVLYSKDGTIIYSYPVAKPDTSFVVPNTVKSVEHYAFDGAENLKTLTVGTGMVAISDLAFIGAFNVETVKILGAVTYIGNNAFGNIRKLQNINIPDTVTYIGKEAFQEDIELKSILIPKSVSYIGVDAFEATNSSFVVYCYSDSYAVSYCETYNIEYQLIDSALSSIVITAPPAKTEYCKNTQLDTTGMVVSAIYSDGISRTVTGYELSDFDSSTLGTKAITVSYTDNGVTRSASFSVSVVDHRYDFSGYVPGEEPTCTEGGMAEYSCAVCGGTKTEAVEALGHDPVDDLWEEPTCTESGMKDIICNRCGDLIEADIVVPALGHTSYQYTKYVEPTCTESGEAAGECSRCGEVFDDILPALGHNFEEQEIVSSCESAGAVITACTRCELVTKARFTPAQGHAYTASVKEPTCTEEGYTTYVCARCQNTYISDRVDALGHDYQTTTCAATCTKSGYTYYKCERCKNVYYGMFENAHGHDYNYKGGKTVVSPTSVKMGYTIYKCKNCNYAYYGDIRQPTGPTSIDASCADSVQVGKTITIKTSLTPSGIVDRVYFQSSNKKIATVSANGVVTGKSVGKVKIKCYLSNGKSKTLTVNVKTPSTSINHLISVAKSRLKITWNQVNYSDGYCVQYSTDKNFKKNRTTKYIAGKKNTSVIYKSLKSGAKYYVRVAAYKTVSGQKSLSAWSKVKTIKVK
ncbi:MAG: leucine-rich repeat protein [Clostridia bacterium]|nr:leucine-rich repeat protein [Clostridia bacterium]